MPKSSPYAWFALVGLIVGGCSPEVASEAGASEQGLSGMEQYAKLRGGGSKNACRHVSGSRLPLGPSDITIVGAGPLDVTSTAFVGEHGQITAVYEAYADDMSNGGLNLATSLDCGRTFSAPRSLTFGSAVNYRTTPSAVKLGRRQYLYFTSANDFGDAPTISRSELRVGLFSEPEVLDPIAGVDTLLSWPRFTEGPFGLGVAVALRTLPDKPSKLAWSFVGSTFREPSTVTPEPSAMPRATFFDNGAAIFTYQTFSEDGLRYWSWWRISVFRTGQLTWTDPMLVTTNSENVHDTAPFLRNDGDVDLYYIDSSLEPTDTFKLYRRSLTQRGVLGPEELVTSVGSPNKPNLTRLPGGKVLLTYSDITRADADGYPLEQVFKTAVLAGDAVLPQLGAPAGR